MIKRFLNYYKPHWKLCAVDIASAILTAAAAVTIPVLVRQILNDILTKGALSEMIYWISVIFALAIFMAYVRFVNTKWGHILGTRMETDMRSDIFRHLQKLSFSYFDNTKTGHIMSRISNDLNTIAEFAHHAPEDFLISLFMISGAFCFMFSFNTSLAIIALVPLPLLLAWGSIFRVRMKQGFMEVRRKIADINSSVENSIQGIREVKSFVNEENEINRFHSVNSEFRNAKEQMYGTMAWFHAGMMFLIESYSLVIVSGGAILAYYGKIDMPDIIAFLLYIRFITNPIRRLVQFVEQYQQGAASLTRFMEIMDIDPDIVDHPQARTISQLQGKISFENVAFKYSSKHMDIDAQKQGDDGEEVISPRYHESDREWVVENINLTVPAGKTVALVGESGAGKSTLASLVPRFYEANKGQIKIDDIDVLDLQKDFLRESIGLVQQNVFLFDTTIRENILFGNPNATEEELIAATKKANIYDFIQSLPNGFDTTVGEHGVKLSGGQKQRVSIARVFLKNPKILIFDEATSSLDSESEKIIQDTMRELTSGRTTLIIAHRLSTVKNADYTYVLKNGNVVEEGAHADLLKLNGYYASLYEHSRF